MDAPGKVDAPSKMDAPSKVAMSMRNRSLMILIAFLFGILLAACSRKQQAEGKIIVAVSIPPLAQFVERIGGDNVRAIIMVPPGASPHTYEPRPSQLVELSEATMYVKVGSPIEFEVTWLDKLVSVNESMSIVDCSKGIAFDTGHSRDHACEHSSSDPHIWVSPHNAAVMVGTICEGLVSIDPGHQQLYKSNRDRYIAELENLDRRIKNTFAAIKSRKFIVYHPAWGYFARRYGLDQLPIEEEGKEPTAKTIASLIENARRDGIEIIFASPQFSSESAEVIAKEIGGRVILIDPLEKEYIANIERVLGELETAMK